MSSEGSQTPRRALDPIPADWNDPSATTPSSATSAGELDDPRTLSDTGMMRRLAFAEDGSLISPESPVPAVGTPVPPPMPVLPEPEAALAPNSGRRFSATDTPYDLNWAAPRRSAASVASPPSYDNPLLPPIVRPTEPPAVTIPYAGAAQQATTGPEADATEPTPTKAEAKAQAKAAKAEAKRQAKAAKEEQAAARIQEKADAKARAAAERDQAKADKSSTNELAADNTSTAVAAEQPVPAGSSDQSNSAAVADAEKEKSRGIRPAVIVIASVAAFALIVAAVVWILAIKSSNSAGTVGSGTAADPLLTTSEITALSSGTWTQAQADNARPLCVPASATGVPTAQRTVTRKLVSATAGNQVIQVVDSYSDEATATQAFSAEATLIGTCPDTAAWISGASTVSGLADSADVVRLTVQDKPTVYHTLLLTRTGRTVNVFDIATTTDVPVATVATTAATALNRQCKDNGTCPGSIAVAAALAPAGNPAGWLVAADLPRVTVGAGLWSANDVDVNTPGTKCEGMDLSRVSGTTSIGQRTLILTDDPKSTGQFGVDQVVYTYSNATNAAGLATRLSSNIASCAKRVPTATVKAGADIVGVGLNGAKITGKTFTVSHDADTQTVTYRIAVITVDKRVTYLLANPTKGFDFTNDEWKAIATRAGERTSQAG